MVKLFDRWGTRVTLNKPTIDTKHHARDYGSRHGQRVRKIVLHHTGGKDSVSWLMGNPRGTSIHVLVTRSGHCYQMVEENFAAYHVGFSLIVIDGVTYSQHHEHSPNDITVGIEIENLGDGKEPYPEEQKKAVAWWVQRWMGMFGLGPGDVIRHGDIDTQGKHDPLGLSAQDILVYLDLPPTTPPVAPPLVPGITPVITDTTSLLSSMPRATKEQAIQYIKRRGVHSSYTAYDVAAIAGLYWEQSRQANLDPLLAIAQMIHETGNLTSWWSLRPRRNPAGIGVTGETRIALRRPGVDWVRKNGVWQRGYSFAAWKDSVCAHLGHLLLYTYFDKNLSQAQRFLVACDPRARTFPVQLRGTATILRDLNGKWAVPGTDYGARIAAIAEAIRTYPLG